MPISSKMQGPAVSRGRPVRSGEETRRARGPDGIDDLCAVLRRINVRAERSLTKRSIDHLDDRVRDRRDIRIRRHDGGETLKHLVRETRIGTGFVFSSSCLVCGRPGMSEVIRSTGESSRNDNRGLDTPARQFARIDYSQGIHAGFRREVRRQIGWSSPRRTAARYPDHETFPLLA